MGKRARERLCRICNKAKPKFVINHRVKSDRDHDICMRCYRSATSTIEFTANLLPIPPDLVVGTGSIKIIRGAPKSRLSNTERNILTGSVTEAVPEHNSTLVAKLGPSTNGESGT